MAHAPDKLDNCERELLRSKDKSLQRKCEGSQSFDWP
jgi:hypothetical protein